MVDFHQQLTEKSRPVAFQQSMGLFGAVTLGVGSLMGAGLYVLVGIAAAEAGPGLWIAYAVCGLLTFLSVGMYAELSRALPVSGGGYLYAYNRLGSFFGFLVGWHLAVGSIFACALYAFGFAYYLIPFLPFESADPLFSRSVAVALVALLTGFALRGGKGGNRLQFFFTWGNLVVVVALIVIALLGFDKSRFTPMLPKGFGGVGGAISLIYISFFGYQLIANASEEIREPVTTVPRAMYISLGVAFFFYVAVAVISVGAVPWKTLAAADAPLVLVAKTGIGQAGGLLIGVGGLLASVAALNGTLVSQARQIFAMGRDRIMPESLGRISETRGIPTLALLAGAGLTAVVILTADLSFVAKAANFSLLFSMLPLSFALGNIYRERRTAGEKIPPLKQAVPFAALAANAALLLTLDYESLMFGGTIVGVSGLVFFTYSYASEKRGQAGYTVRLNDAKFSPFQLRGGRILVPMANPDTQKPLLDIAEALSMAGEGDIRVLNVIVAKEGQNPREALQRESQIGQAVHILDGAALAAKSANVVFTPVVRAARSLAEGIVHAAEEERAKLIIMGWSQSDDATPSPLVETVADRCRCHLVFLHLKNRLQSQGTDYKQVGVALGGRNNTALMVDLANAVTDQQTGRIIYFSVLSEYYEQADLNFIRQGQMDALARHTNPILFNTEILVSSNPLEAIVERTRTLDLLILGAGDTRTGSSGGMGSFAAMVTARAHCSVVILRREHKLVSLIPSQI